MPELSVVVRTCNRPHLLKRALSGLLRQSEPVDEVLIVNNGGDPLDSAFLETLNPDGVPGSPKEKTRPRIEIVELPAPVSLGAAANEGLRRASGTWVAFHDDDDYWPEHHVRDSKKFLQYELPHLLLLGTSVEQVVEQLNADGTEATEIARFPIHNGLEAGPIPLERIVQHNLLPPIALWYRREALLRVGGYAEDVPVLEDWVANRALLLTGPGWFYPGNPVEYRVRANAPAGPLGNTITQRRDEHEFTANRLRDQWLREEWAAGRFGPESFARLSRQLSEQGDRLDWIQRIKAGIRRRLGRQTPGTA